VVFFRFKLSIPVALGSNLKKPVKEKKSTPIPVQVERAPASVVAEWEEPVTDLFIEEENDGQGATELMCVFRSGSAHYAFPISLAKEVVKMKLLTPIPQMPTHILGMTNVRGTVYGVLDLSIFFGNAHTDERKAFLLVLNHEVYKICIAIPAVPDTLYIRDSMKENINATMLKTIKKREYLKSVIKKDDRLIIQLNIIEMITSPSFVNESQQPAVGQK